MTSLVDRDQPNHTEGSSGSGNGGDGPATEGQMITSTHATTTTKPYRGTILCNDPQGLWLASRPWEGSEGTTNNNNSHGDQRWSSLTAGEALTPPEVDNNQNYNTNPFTNLVRLASQLQGTALATPSTRSTAAAASSTTSSSSAPASSATGSQPADSSSSTAPSVPQQQQQPLITVESDEWVLLIKEYDGHAVAVRVPCRTLHPASVATTHAPNSEAS